LSGTVIHEGTAQGSGVGGNQIQLDSGASSIDGSYDPSQVDIIGGTGLGQSRLILQYVGSTRMVTVDRDWKVNPDNTSEFIITGNPGREHVNEGLATSGTLDSITLTANASTNDNEYIGQTISIRSGTGQDQARSVTSYTGSTKTAQITPPWTTIPDSTSAYVVLATAKQININTASSVDNSSADATSTVFKTDLTLVDGVYNDQILLFTSGALKSQARPISSYVQNSGTITVDEAFTEAPSDDDKFAILISHTHPISQIQSGLATSGDVTNLLTTQMTESYAADGVAPTLAQSLFLIQQSLGDFTIASGVLTVHQLDGTSTAAAFNLSPTGNPTATTRAS
jgi:hypothetical protein